MPEPSILFTVTGVVIVSLAAWLAIVFKKANEPWGRTPNADMVVAKERHLAVSAGDPPIEPVVETAPKSEPKVETVAEADALVDAEKKTDPEDSASKS